MTKSKVTYSNRQVKGTEDLFAPGDLDANLVGGTNQEDPYGYTNLNQGGVDTAEEYEGKTVDVVDQTMDKEEYDIELPFDEELENTPLGVITTVEFSQVGKFTGDGTYIADVIATLPDVTGADFYEVEFYRIS